MRPLSVGATADVLDERERGEWIEEENVAQMQPEKFAARHRIRPLLRIEIDRGALGIDRRFEQTMMLQMMMTVSLHRIAERIRSEIVAEEIVPVERFRDEVMNAFMREDAEGVLASADEQRAERPYPPIAPLIAGPHR